MRVGITGHQRLKDSSVWPWVAAEMDEVLTQLPEPLTGISSLAIGADQLFAQVVLERGGALEVILPFEDYARQFEDAQAIENYYRLLERGSRVEVLPARASDEEAYLAAGQRVVDLADCLVAVWDGEPAVGLGGTADVVDYAQQLGKRVIHIDPVARRRSERG